MEPLDYQRRAHDEIVGRARAFFASDGRWQDLPITPRWASLVAGPTGSGKTTVVKMAADTLSRECGDESNRISTLILSTPSWIPVGAHNRGARETLSAIAAHIARHQKTIVVLDELDKLVSGAGGVSGFASSDSWQSYIRAELYTVVLDGRWPVGMSMPDLEDDGPEITIEELTRKLRNHVFMVGVGTFQDWFDSSNTSRAMGFGAEVAPQTEELSADIIAEKMPRELANRFHSTIIRLPELGADDYRRIAQEAELKLPEGMRHAFREEVNRRLPGAIASKKGVRFLEEAITEVLTRETPKMPPSIVEIATPDPSPDTDPCMW